AHRAGLVHCDVKPHNFIVTPDNLLKVTDFGIARALASIEPDEEAEVIWGSPQYFSPEQAAGHPPSPASDVYSLGVVMYYMFTGQLPFNAKTSQELARLHRRANPVPPREINPFIPETLEKIILKVLAKEPAARYRTADQLGRVLQTFLAQYKQEVARRVVSPARPASTEVPSRPRPETPNAPTNATLMPPPSTERPSEPVRANSGPVETNVEEGPFVDWIAVVLGLIALLAVGGLVPFWMWVIFQIQ
ncbi:MAG: protein kinase, partial [Anaerolineales bacterium]|nr:protein kinase [Anaerolineales bacterium]